MPVEYEVVGNYIRKTEIAGEKIQAVSFYPILDQSNYHFSSDQFQVGVPIPTRTIDNATGDKIVHKPSLEEFKTNIMKVMGVSASGGRRRKTRRRHK
jgi:hypothetical protein